MTSSPTPNYVFKRTKDICLPRNLSTDVHSSITHNSPRVETISMSTADEWTDKVDCFRTAGYYSVIRRDRALTRAAAWMNLENILLSERSQSQKMTYFMIPFI